METRTSARSTSTAITNANTPLVIRLRDENTTDEKTLPRYVVLDLSERKVIMRPPSVDREI